MDSQTLGIDKWIAGIRCRMENDPGRQDLADHILCNGFLFLDEYLEDILMGAKTEPIIELTKTPGRRKDMAKKVRSATTAVIKAIPLPEPEFPDKENIPLAKSPVKNPPTSFQKALLKTSKDNQASDSEDGTTFFRSPSRPELRSPFGLVSKLRDRDVQEEAAEILVPPPLAVASGLHPEGIVQTHTPSPYAKQSAGHSPGVALVHQDDSNSPGLDLSIIPEGDETENLGASVPSRSKTPIIPQRKTLHPVPQDPNSPLAIGTVSHDPSADDEDDTRAFQTPYDRSFNESEPTSTASSFPIDPYARDYETHELRYVVGNEQLSEQAHPPPSPPTRALVRKASVPVFPSLPGPSPLRKSTYEPSGGSSTLISTRSSVVTGAGARSSWLNKARDVSANRTSIAGGVKRKSTEFAAQSNSANLDDDHTRATKIAKTNSEANNQEKRQSKMSIQPFRPIISVKSRELPFVQESAAVTPDGNSEGMMDILKRTVEGMGARVGKSIGRSLGGAAAAAAAAEAKAAAEARLAQREAKGSDGTRKDRMSVSDLIGVYNNRTDDSVPIQQTSEYSVPFPPGVALGSRTSTTTPPGSPSVSHKSSHFSLAAPVVATHTIPEFTVQRLPPPEPVLSFLDSQPSTQSTYVSTIFDDPAWAPSSQTTEFTGSQGFTQPESQPKLFPITDEQGPSAFSQEISRSHNLAQNQVVIRDEDKGRIPGAFESGDEDMVLGDKALYGIDIESEVETAAAIGRSTSSALSDSGTTKSKDSSSQPPSQTGFVAQASGLLSKVIGSSVGSALGASKRGRAEPVKSIQLAAVAAKKQQEEADRKAARLREMDKRRAAIASRKAKQEAAEKVKKQDQRKRDREEGQEKRVTRATFKKVDEDIVKKRKVVVEIERKPEIKKPVSKDKHDLDRGKPDLTASQMQPGQATLSKSFKQTGLPASEMQSTVKLVGSSQGEPKAATRVLKSTAKEKSALSALEDIGQPSQALHAQMQGRVDAQLLQARHDELVIPSESIELPDINSEYSDSDDENRPRTFDPPGWAQSPDLRLALESQSRMNPDDIFGPVRPLRMEEIFPTRQSRFRARTSSANWAGTDEVTRDEETQYAKRMGYLD